MNDSTNLPGPETDIRGDCATLFVSLELSRSTWIATSLAPWQQENVQAHARQRERARTARPSCALESKS
jgi:transposase